MAVFRPFVDASEFRTRIRLDREAHEQTNSRQAHESKAPCDAPHCSAHSRTCQSRRSTFFSVEGEVNFNPVPSGTYEVMGELKQKGSSVWIEDVETHQPVTEKIIDQ
jgi:hypothetical protein